MQDHFYDSSVACKEYYFFHHWLNFHTMKSRIPPYGLSIDEDNIDIEKLVLKLEEKTGLSIDYEWLEFNQYYTDPSKEMACWKYFLLFEKVHMNVSLAVYGRKLSIYTKSDSERHSARGYFFAVTYNSLIEMGAVPNQENIFPRYVNSRYESAKKFDYFVP